MAIKKIMKNEKLTIFNVGLKRTLNFKTGLSSKFFNKILGKKAKKIIKIDEHILFSKIKK